MSNIINNHSTVLMLLAKWMILGNWLELQTNGLSKLESKSKDCKKGRIFRTPPEVACLLLRDCNSEDTADTCIIIKGALYSRLALVKPREP